jgi:cation diffusion facilitator family transporter
MPGSPSIARQAPLYRQAVRASLLGLAINGGLGVAKLVGGIVGQSFALLTDAVNSIGDVITSIGVLIALRFAQKPADAEHPYGHTRAEAIAGAYLGVLVLVSAVWLGVEAIGRLGAIHATPPAWTLAIAGANVLIKEGLYRYKINVGRRLGSRALIANAWDHRSDAFSALAVMVGLALVRLGGPRWIAADEAAALVVVALLVWTSTKLIRESIHELLDVQADDALIDAVRREAMAVPGVRGIETLWIRKTGIEYLTDVHIEVDAQMTIADGHLIGHHVKDRLLERFPAIRDVLVHLEPFPQPVRKVGSATGDGADKSGGTVDASSRGRQKGTGTDRVG